MQLAHSINRAPRCTPATLAHHCRHHCTPSQFSTAPAALHHRRHTRLFLPRSPAPPPDVFIKNGHDTSSPPSSWGGKRSAQLADLCLTRSSWPHVQAASRSSATSNALKPSSSPAGAHWPAPTRLIPISTTHSAMCVCEPPASCSPHIRPRAFSCTGDCLATGAGSSSVRLHLALVHQVPMPTPPPPRPQHPVPLSLSCSSAPKACATPATSPPPPPTCSTTPPCSPSGSWHCRVQVARHPAPHCSPSRAS